MEKRESGVDQTFLNNQIFIKGMYKDKIPLDFPSPVKIQEGIIIQWGARIDAAVSKDIRRILRLPGSIHGETGKRVRILEKEEIDYFNPLDEEPIFEI